MQPKQERELIERQFSVALKLTQPDFFIRKTCNVYSKGKSIGHGEALPHVPIPGRTGYYSARRTASSDATAFSGRVTDSLGFSALNVRHSRMGLWAGV